MKGFITFILLVLSLAFGGLLFWTQMTYATVGIQVMHDGKPVNNLEVRIYDTGYSYNRQLDGTFTTDGTGIVTYIVYNREVYGMGGTMLYDFTFMGTTYSFAGAKDQFLVESV